MKSQVSTHTLMVEIQRYLAAVDLFRAEGHEPSWERERTAAEPKPRRRRRLVLDAPPIP